MEAAPQTEGLDPTWGEVYEAWDPAIDGQGNEGLAAALDRISQPLSFELHAGDEHPGRKIAQGSVYGPKASA